MELFSPDRRAFKTPSRTMAGLVTFWILAVYGFVTLTPAFKSGVEYDAAIVSTLQNICLLAVGYYLGGSNSSAAKDETIAKQATAAIAAVAGNVSPDSATTNQKIAAVTDAATIPVKTGPDIEVKIDDVVVPKT